MTVSEIVDVTKVTGPVVLFLLKPTIKQGVVSSSSGKRDRFRAAAGLDVYEITGLGRQLLQK